MIRLTESAIARCFSSATMARAREYVSEGRVLDVLVGADNVIEGEVEGTRSAPYLQRITISERNGRLLVEGECTCPVGEACKHVAAVLLELVGDRVEVNGPGPSTVGVDVPEEPEIQLDPVVSLWLNEVRSTFDPDGQHPPDVLQRVLYILANHSELLSSPTTIEILSARRLKDGSYGKATNFAISQAQSGNWARYVLPEDRRAIDAIVRNLRPFQYGNTRFILSGPDAERYIGLVLATGRCYWHHVHGPALVLGEPRPGAFRWKSRNDGSQLLDLDANGSQIIRCAPPWYVDIETRTTGPLTTGLSDAAVGRLLAAPALRPEETGRVRQSLSELFPDKVELLPSLRKSPSVRRAGAVPTLSIARRTCIHNVFHYSHLKFGRTADIQIPVGKVSVTYDGVEASGPGNEIRVMEGDEVIVLPRDLKRESGFKHDLSTSGWFGMGTDSWKLATAGPWDHIFSPFPNESQQSISARFFHFVQNRVPELRSKGWRVEIEGELSVVATQDVTWRLDTDADGLEWFGFRLGIEVDGRILDLRPILIEALRARSRSGTQHPEQLPPGLTIYHELSEGKVLALPADRLQPLIAALFELFGPSVSDWPEQWNLPAARARDSEALERAALGAGIEWEPPQRLEDIRRKLDEFSSLDLVEAPETLHGELRNYQSLGLSWLQFLREFGFGGILADDMGLGKTVQTLAHILIEKGESRLDRPALIVAPTSTIPNWQGELARFAPSLKVLVLHGSARKASFKSIEDHDVVLTTYALLLRDKDTLQNRQFHIAVLDEAQNIKNSSAAVAHAAYGLKARNRICLSGTPVENNLDELWSLFHFLMPGFLGSAVNFRKIFRTPIEQRGDADARNKLVKRIRPFLLRRTKEQVAPELPQKTEIIERVELLGSQRDLYESLRLAMDQKVRELLSTKGLNRSRIEILDALLKLRQVCCDPRLVKLPSASKVQGSAKLDRLMEMLGELRREGSRILLFSQFTSMLNLIEKSLRAGGYDWVRISGETEDRETPVRRFQSGEVPLFLISLRAGGTGLNLTAADTVIHYDPWWNPAVENQATDRAHRIGQKNAVFVYKLVASGTIEEKVLELQERKALLAGNIYGDSEEPLAALTAADLQWILEPQ